MNDDQHTKLTNENYRDYWSDAFLNRMREIGDPLADDAVGALFESHGVEEVNRVMETLVRNDQPPPGSLPPVIQEYLERTAVVEPPELPLIREGEDMFAEHGPEVIMLLGCYSLPAAYAAAKGVQVLYRTGFLLNRPNRRLFETMQMVIDVMTPGGMGVDGTGIRTAQKVRLMHAAIRHLELADRENPWNPLFGRPINQEDMAATLMVFSYLVLEGLHKMGVRLDDAAQQAYLDAWIAVGRIMGVREDLLPADLAQARYLTDKIHERQIRYSPEGEQMTQALLEMMERETPHPFKGVPASMMRLFLPAEVADFLKIPEHEFEEFMLKLETHFMAELEHLFDKQQRTHRIIRKFNMHLLQWMINMDRGGQRARFRIPDHLRRKWDAGQKEEDLTLLQRLLRWVWSLLGSRR